MSGRIEKRRKKAEYSGWDFCPPEILIAIFEYLDLPALEKCLFVSRMWRNVVDHLGKKNGLWRKLYKTAFLLNAEVLTKKSELTYRDLFFNHHLWVAAEQATIEQTLSKEISVQNMTVYRNKIIVVCKNQIRVFNLETFALKELINHPEDCVSYGENDHMVIIRTVSDKALLYRKCVPHAKYKLIRTKANQTICEKARLYAFVENTCFITDSSNSLWSYRWELTSWRARLLAKYYGKHSSILAINVFYDQVYVLNELGWVIVADMEGRKFANVAHLSMPYNKIHDYYATIFDRCCVILGVPDGEEMNQMFEGEPRKQVVKFRKLSCVRQHGEFLFLGFKDGRIEMFNANKLLSRKIKPEIELKVETFPDYSGEDPAVVDVDVQEIQRAHHILVATESYLYKVLVSYPSLTYIDF